MKIQFFALLFSVFGTQSVLASDFDFPCHPRNTGCGSVTTIDFQNTFVASGGSCFAYQDISDALEQAQKFADANVVQVCLKENSWRVSHYRRVNHGRWCVNVAAEYVCRK